MGEFGLSRLLQSWRRLRRGMAGARRGIAGGAGPAGSPVDRRGRPPRVDRGMHARGRVLAFLLALGCVAAAQAQVVSTRIWPARDYTRLTIESKSEIQYAIFSLKDPERLV